MGDEACDVGKVLRLIDVFGHAPAKHLAEEIPTLMALRCFGEWMRGLGGAIEDDPKKSMVSVCH